MQNTLWSPRERATEKLTTKEVNFSWELAQLHLCQWLYEKVHQDFFITMVSAAYWTSPTKYKKPVFAKEVS